MSDRQLCHSILKPIGDEEDTFKCFMAFNITPRRLVFRVVVGSRIVVPPAIPPHNDTPMTITHDLGFDTIYQTMSCAISSQNQLVMRKTHSNFL